MNIPILNTFTSYLNITPQMIKETKENGTNKILAQGLLQAANKKNQNGRIYPKKILEREVIKFIQKINDGLSGGELDHPESTVVNLKNISHAIRKVWWDNDNLIGIIEILSTPSGQIAQELIEGGIKLGISSRGIGTTKQNESGDTIVNEDFELITWDLVSQPSTHQAFMNPIYENYEYNKEEQFLNKINTIITDILSI